MFMAAEADAASRLTRRIIELKESGRQYEATSSRQSYGVIDENDALMVFRAELGSGSGSCRVNLSELPPSPAFSVLLSRVPIMSPAQWTSSSPSRSRKPSGIGPRSLSKSGRTRR